MKLRFELVVEKDDPGYHVYCQALPGLHVGGDSLEEAMRNVEDAIRAHLESMRKHGEPLPVGCVVRDEPSRFSRLFSGLIQRKASSKIVVRELQIAA